MEDSKKLILLDVYVGKETPYYYVGEGNMTAYIRLGNKSVPVDSITLKRLVLQGINRSYDSLVFNYKFANMTFIKLRFAHKYNTGKDFEDSDYESWGSVDEEENLTNAGILLADESPIRHSRAFCTCWNGFDKASGLIDAIDDVLTIAYRQKMPIKTEWQLERIFQYLLEKLECSCRDICMLLDVQERRARQLFQELQEQNKVESYGANRTR